MQKKELRTKYKSLRKQIQESEREEMSISIANHVLKLPIWEKIYFHIFLPIVENYEVNTEYILHILSGKDKEIVVSKSDFETKVMTHFLLTDNTKFKKNIYNIPEPIDGLDVPIQKIDVVFVPLLAFDKSGHRVGYGKGFYDKFLKNCKPETIKIGLSLFEPEEIIENITEDDIKLSYCVTANGTFKFN